MNITVLTPPPFEPVTMAEIYRHLRLTPDESGSPTEVISHPDDPMLAAQLQAAREFVEVAARRSLVQQRLRLSVAGFPCSRPESRIWLRCPPLIRVERVQYFDAAGALQTLDPANWYATDDHVPELRFAAGFMAPAAAGRPDAVRVEYLAGYPPEGSPTTLQAEYVANVPQALRQAVLLGVQLLYDNLSDGDRQAMERARESLISAYRVRRV